MKKFYISLLTLVVCATSLFAQTPEKLNYQASVRNSSDMILTNTNIGMQISILESSNSGTAVYVETQTPTTNANGLVTIEIGTGTVVSGTFNTIDWSNDSYFIKTEIDITGGTSYTISGTSQLMSVPYALHAKTAETISGTIYQIGEVKQTIGTMPAGWVKLEGQTIASLTATQQTNATSLGLSGNLPNATNAYLSQNGGALGSVSGSNTKTIAQANLPNVNFTGTTSTDGDHTHTLSNQYGLIKSNAGSAYIGSGSGEYTKKADNVNLAIGNNGDHDHTVSVGSGGSGTALDITPNTLSVDTYIYLGE